MKTRTIQYSYMRMLVMIIMLLFIRNPLSAQSYKDVTMSVGETKTLYLPSYITSKRLKSVTFYTNGPGYVDVQYYTMSSVTVIARKSFSSPIIIRCDYRYWQGYGNYIYEAKGAYDFMIHVKDIPVSRISLPPAKTIYVGEREYLTPDIYPSNATSSLTWSSSNYNIVNVDQEGSILAQRSGSSVITVKTSNGKSASCQITAIRRPVEVSYIRVYPSSCTINENESYQLSVEVHPTNATDKNVTWTSSDPSIVKVNNQGKITGIQAGETTIIAQSTNGHRDLCFVTCKAVIPDLTISDKEGVTHLPQVANILYERKFLPGWNSCCIPFPLDKNLLSSIGPECKISLIKDIEIEGKNRYITLLEVESIKAGTPCLIYSPKEITCKIQLKNVTLQMTPDNTSILKSSFQKQNIGPGFYKLNKEGNQFGQTQHKEAFNAPFRCYLDLEERSISNPIENNTIKILQSKTIKF